MLKINEVRVNKLLTIVIIILTVFILICAYYLKNIREKEEQELLELKEKQQQKDNSVAGVIYTKEVFGSEFDFANIDSVSVLDEYNNLKFVKYENVYYVLSDTEVLNCNYMYDENKKEYNYRYCIAKDKMNDEYTIDFASLKFMENND